MVSGRQMIELLRLANRFEARLIFCGDTKQIQSVEASDALRILVDEKSIASVGLRKVQRQESKQYREAIETLRVNPTKAFTSLKRWARFMNPISSSDRKRSPRLTGRPRAASWWFARLTRRSDV
jgi:hypothetical protein